MGGKKEQQNSFNTTELDKLYAQLKTQKGSLSEQTASVIIGKR